MQKLVWLAVSLLLLSGCGTQTRPTAAALFFHPDEAIAPPAVLGMDPLRGDIVPMHDPTMIRQGSTYYIVSTDNTFERRSGFLPIRCSQDGITWRMCGTVFSSMPDWVRSTIPEARQLWAPDISYYAGSYHLYYAASRLGSQHSAIGLATNTTLDARDPAYHWVDHGMVIQSNTGDKFNAVDANLFAASDGTYWLTYGSYWSGIRQQQIDPATGMLMAHSRIYLLATRPHTPDHSVEAGSLVYHNGFYYLFASIDRCCERDISQDNYKEIVGRSRSPHGIFIDQSGTSMRRGGGNLLLETGGDWLAPGGGSAYFDPGTARWLFCFHALRRSENGALYLWIKQIDWQNDWPIIK